LKTPEQIFAKHEEDPLAAADELLRRGFDGKQLEEASVAWCDFYADRRPALGSSSATHDDGSLIVDMVLRAYATSELLGAWAVEEKQRPRPVMWDAEPVVDLLLDCWTVKDDAAALLPVVRAWARRRHEADRRTAALALRALPEIAYSLLGPLEYKPTAHPCFGCKVHPRPAADSGFAHLCLVRARRRDGLAPHTNDDAVLAALPSEAVVEEPSLMFMLRQWLHDGLAIPSAIAVAVERACEDPQHSHRWRNAVVLMCGRPEDACHRRAVAALANRMLTHEEPATAWKEFFGRPNGDERMGLFTGRGWGRKARRRKLLPLARAFLAREVWPTEPWAKALTAFFNEKAAPDPAEAQREVLAEALLHRVLDPAVSQEQRVRALEGLRTLQPGGDGSLIKALGKLRGSELEALATDVRKTLRTRGTPMDADLALGDACEVLFGSTNGTG